MQVTMELLKNSLVVLLLSFIFILPVNAQDKSNFNPTYDYVWIKEPTPLYYDEDCTNSTTNIYEPKTKLIREGIGISIDKVKDSGLTLYIPKDKITNDLGQFTWDFEIEGNIYNQSIEIVDYYYKKIPEKILNLFKENKWKLVLTDKTLGEDVQGLTVFNEKTIYLFNNGEYLKDAVFHEFGHFFDNINNDLSLTIEFQSIYEEENSKLFFIDETLMENAKTNSAEYFAEIFQQYFLNRNSLKNYCPLSFKFIKEKMED